MRGENRITQRKTSQSRLHMMPSLDVRALTTVPSLLPHHWFHYPRLCLG